MIIKMNTNKKVHCFLKKMNKKVIIKMNKKVIIKMNKKVNKKVNINKKVHRIHKKINKNRFKIFYHLNYKK